MTTFPIVAVGIGLVIVALLAVAFIAFKSKGNRPETDYRVFYILGATWLPLGLATDNPGFWGMGAVFFLAGLLNTDKWSNDGKWSELAPRQQYLALVIGLGLVLTVAAVVALFLLGER
jgi:hypothetical protein